MKTPNRVSVVGIDGSGKSTAAHEAALDLSSQFRGTPIRIVDSSGIATYHAGEVTTRQFENLETIKAHHDNSLPVRLARTVAFTTARRAAETWSTRNEGLTIGVRDPYRIDMATYLPIVSETAGKMSPRRRLALFDRITTAAHPLVVVQLEVDPDVAYANAKQRGVLEPHETPRSMHNAANDLSQISKIYQDEYGVAHHTVPALQRDTSSQLTARLEPFFAYRHAA